MHLHGAVLEALLVPATLHLGHADRLAPGPEGLGVQGLAGRIAQLPADHPGRLVVQSVGAHQVVRVPIVHADGSNGLVDREPDCEMEREGGGL